MAGHRDAPLRDPETAVTKAIDELRRAYKVGQILRELGHRAAWGKHQIRDKAAEHGYSEETGRCLRQFAKVYRETDLNRLCNLCKRHGRALGISWVVKFVTIKKRQDRRKIEQEAILGHWTHVRLERELRHRFRRERGHRGRKPKLPSAKIEALEQTREMAYTFVRFATRLQDERRKWLSDQVEKDLSQAVAALESLQASTARSLARSQAGQAGKARRSRRRS